ncbi:MAG: hypothetical protein K0R54_1199 [Clostridiaceae bacterium]|nr:hypothetical protein [Clostridiaceae bacterium]
MEAIILDSKFTKEFNSNIKKLYDSIKTDGNDNIEFTILFNTSGEIAVIDGYVLGSYAADKYTLAMEEYYKKNKINKVVKQVVNGSRKSMEDFLILSEKVLYNTFLSMFSEIKTRKDIIEKYKYHKSLLKSYKGDDLPIIFISLLIIEDICKYLGINKDILTESYNKIIFQKYSQNI